MGSGHYTYYILIWSCNMVCFFILIDYFDTSLLFDPPENLCDSVVMFRPIPPPSPSKSQRGLWTDHKLPVTMQEIFFRSESYRKWYDMLNATKCPSMYFERNIWLLILPCGAISPILHKSCIYEENCQCNRHGCAWITMWYKAVPCEW